MGKEVRSRGLIDALFDQVMQRLLALLIGQADRSFSTSELIRLVGSGTGAVQRLLLRLSSADLVTVTSVGNQRRYKANTKSPIFPELHGIIRKTIGLTMPIADALAPMSHYIRVAFVYGSVAKKVDSGRSDIDLMIIADQLTYPEIFNALLPLDMALGRTISPKVMTMREWKGKLAVGNAFVRKVNAQPKLFVIGHEDELA